MVRVAAASAAVAVTLMLLTLLPTAAVYAVVPAAKVGVSVPVLRVSPPRSALLENAACSSKAPMSQRALLPLMPATDRANPDPRWSLTSAAFAAFLQPSGSPASIAGLPASSAWVLVGPLLSLRVSSLG